jgi:hypothetical protein
MSGKAALEPGPDRGQQQRSYRWFRLAQRHRDRGPAGVPIGDPIVGPVITLVILKDRRGLVAGRRHRA